MIQKINLAYHKEIIHLMLMHLKHRHWKLILMHFTPTSPQQNETEEETQSYSHLYVFTFCLLMFSSIFRLTHW